MESVDAHRPANAPQEGTSGTTHVGLPQDNVPVVPGSSAAQGNANSRGGRRRAARSIRGGRRQATPRERGGASRGAKRSRSRRDVDNGHEDEDNDGASALTKKPKSVALDLEGNHPAEVHRSTTSLRDRLIKGEYTPQAVGMRVYNMNKQRATAAAAAPPPSRNAQREFLVPIDPRLDAMAPVHSTNKTMNFHNAATNMEPINLNIAYKSTPLHQLHFPEGLVLALKQNMVRWEDRQHSEGLVFVVLRIVNGDAVGTHVFSTLHDATTDAIHMMINEHPEAFAVPRTIDDQGFEMKHEKYERAASLIQDINARRSVVQVPMLAPPAGREYGSGQSTGTLDGSRVAHADEHYPLYVVKDEEPGAPVKYSRYPSPVPDLNNRGQILLSDAPDPVFVFSGKFCIVSYGLKMEARRPDGAIVKVSVHLKNLRGPSST